jgi:phosphoribosylglycinamide formyltransferase-1
MMGENGLRRRSAWAVRGTMHGSSTWGIMKSIVILISGRGSNMEAIVRADIAAARISAVISNRADAKGLEFAAAHGIPTAVVDHRAFAGRAEFDAALIETIEAHGADLVVLAGFMRVLTEGFVRRYEGRLLNIHPSLLPAFPGLKTHRRALETGVRVHGATVHFVTAALDCGPVVVQAVVPVLPDDDEATLAARVLAQEHRIYPQAVRWFVEERLSIEAGVRVRVHGEAGCADGCIVPALECVDARQRC